MKNILRALEVAMLVMLAAWLFSGDKLRQSASVIERHHDAGQINDPPQRVGEYDVFADMPCGFTQVDLAGTTCLGVLHPGRNSARTMEDLGHALCPLPTDSGLVCYHTSDIECLWLRGQVGQYDFHGNVVCGAIIGTRPPGLPQGKWL